MSKQAWIKGHNEKCVCGQPLHYSNPFIGEVMKQIVASLGQHMEVVTSRGVWRVPRHYIALHGLKPEELPQLAALYPEDFKLSPRA